MSTVATIGAHALQVNAEVWKRTSNAPTGTNRNTYASDKSAPTTVARSRAFLNIQTEEQDKDSFVHRAIPFIAIALWGGSWALTSRGESVSKRRGGRKGGHVSFLT
jgi:hypothetical protein